MAVEHITAFTYLPAQHTFASSDSLIVQSWMKVDRKVQAHQDGTRLGSSPASLTLVLRRIGQ